MVPSRNYRLKGARRERREHEKNSTPFAPFVRSSRSSHIPTFPATIPSLTAGIAIATSSASVAKPQ